MHSSLLSLLPKKGKGKESGGFAPACVVVKKRRKKQCITVLSKFAAHAYAVCIPSKAIPPRQETKRGHGPATVTSMPHLLRRPAAVTRPARRAVGVSRGGGGQRPLALAVRPAEERKTTHQYRDYREEEGNTHIRTLPSSPAVANMHGSVGFQATALQLVWCVSTCCTKMPVNLCQMKTCPSRSADLCQ